MTAHIRIEDAEVDLLHLRRNVVLDSVVANDALISVSEDVVIELAVVVRSHENPATGGPLRTFLSKTNASPSDASISHQAN